MEQKSLYILLGDIDSRVIMEINLEKKRNDGDEPSSVSISYVAALSSRLCGHLLPRVCKLSCKHIKKAYK